MKHQIGDRIKFYGANNKILEARIIAIGSLGKGFTENSNIVYELENGTYIYEEGILNEKN